VCDNSREKNGWKCSAIQNLTVVLEDEGLMDGTVLIIAGDNGGAKNNAAAVPFSSAESSFSLPRQARDSAESSFSLPRQARDKQKEHVVLEDRGWISVRPQGYRTRAGTTGRCEVTR
jgi:hypothetical protein